MKLPPAHEQEELSLAYISALAARSAVQCTITGKLEYGVDIYMQTLYSTDGLIIPKTPPVSVQVKATKNWQESNGSIVYDMEVDAYQKLYHQSAAARLFLFCLPVCCNDWLNVSVDSMIIRKCCYWYKVTTPSQNRSKQRIRIPITQLITVDTLPDIIEGARLEMLLC
ncbi:MAG: DUF4365 domain-containing protein [Chloroflexaceae bacterium]|nr:DUF4365 domain-containing protein [Chloroflexaceae bacterium]